MPQVLASQLCSSPLDGSGQFTLLSLLVALVAYIRNIPVKQLVDSRSQISPNGQQTQKTQRKQASLAWIDLQLFVLNIVQIFLVSISVLVAGRSLYWGPAHDDTIFASLFVLSILFFLLHIVVDGVHVLRYLCNILETFARKLWRL